MAAPSAASMYAIPSDSWDAHLHVTDIANFQPPLNSGADYFPQQSSLSGALEHATALSVPNLVLVQPSTFGLDNECLLRCLIQLRTTPSHRRARGIVVIDPAAADPATMRAWHGVGVRGVRLNPKALGKKPTAPELRASMGALHTAIERAEVENWSIHIHADLECMKALAEMIKEGFLGQRKVCIDHMGSPPPCTIDAPGPKGAQAKAWADGVSQSKDWKAFKKMLETEENVFVKVSAPYRFVEPTETWASLEVLARELMACRRGESVVFASDWPHTRFEGTDITFWRDLCASWCGEDEKLRMNLFRRNAERLYDVHD